MARVDAVFDSRPGPLPEAPRFAGLRLATDLCDSSCMVAGACLCGALQYEVEGPLQNLVHCHCSMCRKFHGAPFGTLVEAPAHHLRWLAGEASVVGHASSAQRTRCFCGTCGSVAPAAVAGRLLVPAGNLQGDLEVAAGLHVFVGSKAPWHIIADALPQHESVPPGWYLQEVVRANIPRSDGLVQGSCLCGEVTFTVAGPPGRWLQCHCSRCRRARSAAHGSNAFYPAGQFAWRTGRESVRTYRPPEAERFAVSFCTRCGGGAPVERDNVPFVLVPAGLFDGDPGARPQAHIHVASRAPWYSAADGLPQFPELPPT
jgi:hypothetical protein